MHTNLPCKGRSSPAWILSWRDPPAIALAFFLSVIIWGRGGRERERAQTNLSNSPNALDILWYILGFVIKFCMKSFSVLSSIKQKVLLRRFSVKYGTFGSWRTKRPLHLHLECLEQKFKLDTLKDVDDFIIRGFNVTNMLFSDACECVLSALR